VESKNKYYYNKKIFSELLFKIQSTTPAFIRLHLRCILIRATPPGQVFHPEIERSEIIGKGSLKFAKNPTIILMKALVKRILDPRSSEAIFSGSGARSNNILNDTKQPSKQLQTCMQQSHYFD
jgi:hypothetical protein